MYHSLLILTLKTALKSVLIFHEVTDKNKLAPFFMAHGVYDVHLHLLVVPAGQKHRKVDSGYLGLNI